MTPAELFIGSYLPQECGWHFCWIHYLQVLISAFITHPAPSPSSSFLQSLFLQGWEKEHLGHNLQLMGSSKTPSLGTGSLAAPAFPCNSGKSNVLTPFSCRWTLQPQANHFVPPSPLAAHVENGQSISLEGAVRPDMLNCSVTMETGNAPNADGWVQEQVHLTEKIMSSWELH